MKNQKVRTTAEVKRIQERESVERMNKRASEIEDQNEMQGDHFIHKTLEFPLRRSDGTLAGPSPKHRSKDIFQRK